MLIFTILIHQLLSERRFFAQFVCTEGPSVEELTPAREKPVGCDYARPGQSFDMEGMIVPVGCLEAHVGAE